MDQKSHAWTIEALGTHWQFFVWQKDFKTFALTDLQFQTQQTVQDFEQNYSRFKTQSFVGQLNCTGILENPGDELLGMLELGESLKALSADYFDLCIGQDLVKLGYGHLEKNSSKTSAKNKKLPSFPASINFQDNTRIDFNTERVLLRPGYQLDLGGIGKGFLVDKLARQFQDSGFSYFLINGGGDIFGSQVEEGQGIDCLLENPFDSTEAIGRIMLQNTAIASSSSNRRHWTKANQNQATKHHLIDPFTADSKLTTILAVYTQSVSCVQADLGSTAIFVSPPELWPKIQDSLNLEFLVIYQDGSYWHSRGYEGQLF